MECVAYVCVSQAENNSWSLRVCGCSCCIDAVCSDPFTLHGTRLLCKVEANVLGIILLFD